MDNLQELEVVKYMPIMPIVKKHKNSIGNHWKSNLKPNLLLDLRNSDMLWLIGYFVTKLWFDINHPMHGYWRNHLLSWVIPTILERMNYLKHFVYSKNWYGKNFRKGGWGRFLAHLLRSRGIKTKYFKLIYSTQVNIFFTKAFKDTKISKYWTIKLHFSTFQPQYFIF